MNIPNSDIIGVKFQKLTILSKTKKKTQGNCYFYLAKCDCGKEIHILKSWLKDRKYGCQSCASKEVMKKRNEDYEKSVIGSNVNGWEICDVIKNPGNKRYIGKCKCGNIKIKSISEFKKHVCKKCSMKSPHNSKRCLENAKSLIGSTKGPFRILGVIGVIDKHIVLRCKCLNCKNVTNIRNGLLYSRKTCSCCRYTTKPKGSNNHMTSLKEPEIISMRELFKTGLYTPKALAEMYRINIYSVYAILNRRTWKHI